MLEPKLGRPHKYNSDIHKQIIKSIKRNAPYKVAAWSARVCERTFYNWITWGRDDIKNDVESDFAQLLQDILSTEANKIMDHLDAIEKGNEGWRGRLLILERRWREFFGQDAGIIQDLVEIITKLKQDMNEFKTSQEKGEENTHEETS